MQVNTYQLIEGARKAEGTAVIIDVFRAFSLACYLFDRGVKKIIPVGELEKAYELKKENPEYLLFGERNERVPEGFDFGNSPTHVEQLTFTGKTVIHTTSAGTQGISNASKAREIITGSLVNASAIAAYLKKNNPGIVSLVCMGYGARCPADEDTFCAEYIQNLLEDKPYPIQEKIESLKTGSGKRLLDPKNQSFSPARDFELCTRLNAFNFVLKVNQDENTGLQYLRRIY
jgi:2-phosphosulfolactate phosphatase